MTIETFTFRVYAILREPLAEAIRRIDAEEEVEVLTQARDVCPDDRIDHLEARITTLRSRLASEAEAADSIFRSLEQRLLM